MHTTSRSRQARLQQTIAGCAVALAVLPVATAAAQQLTLDGEVLRGPAAVTCPEGGEGNGSFSSRGTLGQSGSARGPYPGGFRETGTFTMEGGRVTALAAQFTITSSSTTISGTKSLLRDGSASCLAGNPPAIVFLDAETSYEATIASPDGCFTDTGTSSVSVRTPFGLFSHELVEEFLSGEDAAMPCNEVSIGDAPAVTEGGVARFVLSLVRPAASPVSVRATTGGGSASADRDYEPTSRVVTIPAGGRSATFEVQTLDDPDQEPAETFGVELSNPVGTVISDPDSPDATGIILDNERDGEFGCRATGLRVGTTELIVANVPNSPCRDGTTSLIPARLGTFPNTVTADVVHARTDSTPDDPAAVAPAPGDRSHSHAAALDVEIRSGTNVITATLLEANATASCTGSGPPTLSSSGSVTSLLINKTPQGLIERPLTIPLGAATLHLNRVTTSNGRITRQALYLDNPRTVPDIVVGEATAGYSGNPCSA